MSEAKDIGDIVREGGRAHDPQKRVRPANERARVVPMRKELKLETVSDVFAEIVAAAKAATPAIGLKTGHFRLDAMLCGLRRQNVTVLGARTSFGKTSKALQITDLGLLAGHNVLFVSCEDTKMLCGKRFMARRARVNAMRLRANKLRPDDIRKMEDAANSAEKKPFLVEAIGSPVEDIAAMIRDACKANDFALVIVDYVQRIPCTKRQQDRRNEVTYVGDTLSTAIKLSNASGLLLSQLKRVDSGNPNKEPTMADLKESGDLENAAEHVLIGHAVDDGNGEKTRKLKVEKNKDGPVFDEWIEMPFDNVTASFKEVDGEAYGYDDFDNVFDEYAAAQAGRDGAP